MSVTFNPPKPDPTEYKFATFIPDRRKTFKRHKTLGQARGAITASLGYKARDGYFFDCDMYVYELINGDWVSIHEFLQGETWKYLPWQESPDPVNYREIFYGDLQRKLYVVEQTVSRGLDNGDLDFPQYSYLAQALNKVQAELQKIRNP